MLQEKGEDTAAEILIVDDNPNNLKVLLQVLEAAGHGVLVATNGENALKIAGQALPDLVLLDVMMPGMDGYEVCRRLKQDATTQPIPVIFITANNQTEAVVAGFAAGGVDYIPKPFRREEVLARVQAHLSLHQLARELEEKNLVLEQKNRELRETHEQLEQAQRQLIDELEEELQTAHGLQMDLMPTQPPRVPGFDIAGRCLPANHVCGDFFQYLPQDDRLSICLADVTGHAMEAAIPMVRFSGILESEIKSGQSLEKLFASLNETLCAKFARRTFVCCAMGEIDPAAGRLRLSNSGCPYPYHYRASSRQLAELRLDAYPLGACPGIAYRTIEIPLESGDRIVFCSDGVIEACDPEGEMFGFARTAELIHRGCQENLSAAELLDRVTARVKAFTGDSPQADDMTCVVVRVE